MKSESFPAKHEEFYSKFEKWRKEKIKEILPSGGVYKLISNKEIGRFLKTDEEGVLYIGKGDILSNQSRVGKFVNAINEKEKRHGGGSRFNTKLIKDSFPLKNSKIQIILTETPEKLEAEILKEYLEKFGELPPFNRRMES